MPDQNSRPRSNRETYHKSKNNFQNKSDYNNSYDKNQNSHHHKNKEFSSDFEQKNIILPGLKPVLELLQEDAGKIDQIFLRKGRTPKDSNTILDLCREKGVRFALVEDTALARLCQNTQGVNHQGVVARLRGMSYIDVEDLLEQAFDAPLPLIVALDQVLDPGNVGTLVRTLYALGVAGLIVPRHNSAFLGAGAQRSSAGALEKLPIAEVVNLARTVELAAKSGFTTYAAELDGINALATNNNNKDSSFSQNLITNDEPHNTNNIKEQKKFNNPLQLPAVLVLGSEEKGVRQGIQKHCHHKITIPFLREFDSLNVAQAGAILTSCFLRAHKF